MENTKAVVQINGGLAEKGNLKRAVQADIKDQGAAKFLGDFELTPKGEYVYHVADVDGKPVYLKVRLSVSIADNLFDAPKSSKAATEDAPEIGSLFD